MERTPSVWDIFETMLSVMLDKTLTVRSQRFVPADLNDIDFSAKPIVYGAFVDTLDHALPKPEIMAWLEANCRGRYSIRMAPQKSQFEDERLEIRFHDDLEALHFKMMWGSGMEDDNEPVS